MNIKKEIIAHAKECYPQECCGLVVRDHIDGNQFYVPCKNMAADPLNYFEIDPQAIIEAEEFGQIEALVHSHPEGEAKLSGADLQMQMLNQWDFWLVVNEEIHRFPKIAPFIGREFIHGKQDCYSIFRDFYRLAGFEMPDFERDDYWWEDGFNLYLDNIEKQGFFPIDFQELQVGDVILIQLGANVPNHAAIYLGEQMVLHHSPRRLSKRDLYDGYWLKHTHSIWRHKRWSTLNFTVPLSVLELNSN